ncbi:MAG: hypothetical protein R3C11_25375 [Planctomycetaceae bacterium]
MKNYESSPARTGRYGPTTDCDRRQQEQLARNTYRIQLRCPDVARQITPGQFFMIRKPGCHDPLFGRPFALLTSMKKRGGCWSRFRLCRRRENDFSDDDLSTG